MKALIQAESVQTCNGDAKVSPQSGGGTTFVFDHRPGIKSLEELWQKVALSTGV
ncbi:MULTISPECIES: hypothetical protein [Paraburkholderia]|uniref:hypothetical protein n=1 Tax=Paraburkholderia TaxID=1822464 RepID=UPI0038B6CB8E